MLALADWCDDEGVCWPSIPKLAEKSRVSERQVQYLLRGLESMGELHVDRSPGGRHKRSTYYLTIPETMQTVQSETETVQPTAPHPSGEPSDKELGNSPSMSPPHRKTEITDGFIEAMVSEYTARLGGEQRTRAIIADALAHKNRFKYDDKQQYLRGWLRRDVERFKGNGNGTHREISSNVAGEWREWQAGVDREGRERAAEANRRRDSAALGEVPGDDVQSPLLPSLPR